MLYPPTITDEKSVADELSSGDEVDDCVSVRKKTKRKSITSEFANDFAFEIASEEKDDDELKAVRAYLKKTKSSNLQEKIDRERATLAAFAQEEQQQTGKREQSVDESSMHIVQEMEHIADTLRDKKNKKRAKQKDAESAFFDEDAGEVALSAEPSISFEYMKLSRPMLKAIGACGYTKPTPIQASCIPLALAGRDVCACAATGTGKTAAFIIPILERLLFKPKRKSVTRVLVVVPTRELALQVFHVTRTLAQYNPVEICLCAGIRHKWLV
ncbi:unnamed protein product [Anisakis simplex]|uniref:RNA helicase n=1 Tax=Anisakis simplex TaxID=6269 RepID=A0A0M3JU38_ANISI|nr:unnamed protein product [Anisakis simplex]